MSTYSVGGTLWTMTLEMDWTGMVMGLGVRAKRISRDDKPSSIAAVSGELPSYWQDPSGSVLDIRLPGSTRAL